MSGGSSKVLEAGGNMSMSDYLLIEEDAPIAWFKLNRPKVMNSLNTELLKAIKSAAESMRDRRDIRVVILTGVGTKVFCAGADLTERKGMSEGQVLDYLNLIQQTMLAVENMPQVVIAAVNGSAFGGGTELALACDLRIMDEEAVMRLTEVRLGIIPGAGGTQRLTRLIGKSRAKEMILTAKPVNGKEAKEIGLVHKLVAKTTDHPDEHKELINAARNWAREIAGAAPLSLRAAKQAIDEGFDCDLSAGLAVETRAYLQLLNTRDRLEGLAAFAEKREPVYTGQ